MVAHSVKGNATHGFCQAHPLQHGYARWHQPFAARLFFGELPLFKELHRESLPPK
jgi:hypothetical protein